MKKGILTILLLIFSAMAIAQKQEEIEKLIKQGVTFHDKGEFEAAITQFDKVLELDSFNLIALAEKAFTLHQIGMFNEATESCRLALDKHKDNPELRNVYVTMGSALESQNKSDEALKVYLEGIKAFPEFYLLHYNLGVSLVKLERSDEALYCFQQSAACNPRHASTHNALAQLLHANKKEIPALFAFSRFLILEPDGKRANENYLVLQQIMKGGVEKTGDKVTLTLDPSQFGDTTANGKAKPNNFGTVQFNLSIVATQDHNKRNKKKTEPVLFKKKMESVCQSLKEEQAEGDGFYWKYYAPYFIEMYDQEHLETFSYIVLATSSDPRVKDWIRSHKKEIDYFYEWSKNFVWKSE